VSGGDILAQLMRQGAERGADLATLRAIAEEAGALGATRALERLGLGDQGAGADVRELRELLATWRDAKRASWRAAAGWLGRAGCAVVLAALAVKLEIGRWFK